MDILLLSHYVTFAHHLSFTEAAKALCLTQPTLSKQIALMEEEVGAELVDRSGRQLTLTPAGVIYLDGAIAILARRNKMFADIAALDENDGGLLSISGLSFGAVLDVIHSFREKYPLIRLAINSGSIPSEIDTILKSEMDACFGVYSPRFDCPGLQFLSLRQLPLCIVVERSHRLANRDKIPASELKNEVLFIQVDDSSNLSLCLSDLFKTQKLSVSIETRYTSNPLELLINLGGMVFLWVLGLQLPGFQKERFSIVEVEGDGLELSYGVWYREDSLNPALSLFLEELKSASPKAR